MPPGSFSQRRILFVIGVIAAIAIGRGATVYLEGEVVRRGLVGEQQTISQLSGVITSLTAATFNQHSAISDHLLTGRSSSLARYRTSVESEDLMLRDAMSLSAGLPVIQANLVALTHANEDWHSRYADPAIAAVASGDPAAMAAFADRASDDHDPVSRALGEVHSQLRVQTTELAARDEALAETRKASAALQLVVGILATGAALWIVRRYGRTIQHVADRARVLNRFTAYSNFALDDQAIAAAALTALSELISPDAAVVHLLNRSKDRAVPEATLGSPNVDVLALNALSRCPGVLRGSTYVTIDAGLPLSVRCPVYPADHGTLACIPLDGGEPIGALHLSWEAPGALPLDRRADVARIVEHAALAIGNRRLMAALKGQAAIDGRTGLANSRSFDQAFEQELLSVDLARPIGVLMLDLDQFKDFNDRHGHPAGDEALRVLAGVMRSCVRDEDIVARYGGEEFAVLLPGLDEGAVHTVAERIRERTAATIITLGPGITDRVTVSIGVAMAPAQGTDRINLMRSADEALYRAKAAGRNRVVGAYDQTTDPAADPGTVVALLAAL